MSIQSTIHISRQNATLRIEKILALKRNENYSELEAECFEPGLNVEDFVHGEDPEGVESLENWTNSMLSRVLDKPFFRYSMFENYSVYDPIGSGF